MYSRTPAVKTAAVAPTRGMLVLFLSRRCTRPTGNCGLARADSDFGLVSEGRVAGRGGGHQVTRH